MGVVGSLEKNNMKACKNPSQIESHRIYLISPVSCDNTCEILLTKKLTEDLARFLFRASQGFSGSSAGKESTCNAGKAGDMGLIPGLGRFPGEGNGNPLQYSCRGNPMGRGAWWAIVYGVAKNWTQLSD